MIEGAWINEVGAMMHVTYTITEDHYCTLARIAHHGPIETCMGKAKFLQAIAPLVWSGLRLTVTEIGMDPKGSEPTASVEKASQPD